MKRDTNTLVTLLPERASTTRKTHPPPNAEDAPGAPGGAVFCAMFPNVMPVSDEPSDSNSEFDWPPDCTGDANAAGAAAV